MGVMKKLTVELFGPARRLSGQKQVALEMGDGATLRDVVAMLAERFPQLVGSVIEPEYQLSSSYMLNYNGKRTARSLDEIPGDGDRLLLLPVDAGG
jgi:molybdopterin converting factor small subunit